MRESALAARAAVAQSCLKPIRKSTMTENEPQITQGEILGERTIAKNENQNALKHGAFAAAVILPGEDVKEFEELHNSLIDELKPEGPTEHDTVSTIANLVWRKRRLVRYRQNEVAKFEGKKSAEHHRTINSIKELTKILDDANSGTQLPKEWVDYFNRYAPREKYASHDAWIAAVGHRFDKGILALKTKASSTPKIEKVYANEECLIQELATEERIDAMIDKAIKRLAQIKALKTIVIGTHCASVTNGPLKQIASPATQDEEISFLSHRM
jgi:hypothetical protein